MQLQPTVGPPTPQPSGLTYAGPPPTPCILRPSPAAASQPASTPQVSAPATPTRGGPMSSVQPVPVKPVPVQPVPPTVLQPSPYTQGTTRAAAGLLQPVAASPYAAAAPYQQPQPQPQPQSCGRISSPPQAGGPYPRPAAPLHPGVPPAGVGGAQVGPYPMSPAAPSGPYPLSSPATAPAPTSSNPYPQPVGSVPTPKLVPVAGPVSPYPQQATSSASTGPHPSPMPLGSVGVSADYQAGASPLGAGLRVEQSAVSAPAAYPVPQRQPLHYGPMSRSLTMPAASPYGASPSSSYPPAALGGGQGMGMAGTQPAYPSTSPQGGSAFGQSPGTVVQPPSLYGSVQGGSPYGAGTQPIASLQQPSPYSGASGGSQVLGGGAGYQDYQKKKKSNKNAVEAVQWAKAAGSFFGACMGAICTSE